MSRTPTSYLHQAVGGSLSERCRGARKGLHMGAIHLHRDGAVARLVIDNQPRNMATTVMFEQLGQHVRDIP